MIAINIYLRISIQITARRKIFHVHIDNNCFVNQQQPLYDDIII